MAQMTLSHCDCCGQTVDLAQFEFCPRCQYPVNPVQEQLFLEISIRDLQRVARYGGSALRVLDLLRRYEGRLQFLTTHHPLPASSAEPIQTASEIAAASVPVSVEHPRQDVRQQPEVAPVERSAAHLSVAPLPAMSIQPAASMRGFSLSGDAMVNVLASVGGFLVLAGVLSTVFVTSSLWLSFLVVLGIHLVFGGASLVTRRSALLRAVSPLYTIIFALLVPLLAFSAYRLVENNLIALSVPYLLTLSALYAAVIYGVLAVVQRFVPFAYLGSVALLVGDLALAQALNLAYWWWPSIAMLLALVALIALPRPSGRDLFAEQRAILRTPLLVLMYTVVAGAAFCAPVLWLVGQGLNNLTPATQIFSREPRLALFVLASLFVLWYALWLWRSRRTQQTPLLVYLCLILFLSLGNALFLDLTGFVLLETGVALLYHVLVRVTDHRFAGSGFPGRTLDGLALGLVVLVLLQTSAAVPFQLFSVTLANPFMQGTRGIHLLSMPFTATASDMLDLCALGVCLLVTLDMSLMRAGLRKIPTRANWCWLLVLAGLLLSAFYGLEVLLWQVYPLWAFLVFSLGMLLCAVLVRRFASRAWAAPLELLTLGEMAFTLILSLGQSWSIISGLLIGFAAVLYTVSLYQHRPLPAWYSTFLLLLSLISLQNHLIVVLALSLFLPLLVAVLQRTGLFNNHAGELMVPFTWPLLLPALIFGLMLVNNDMSQGQSVFAHWAGMHQFPTSGLANWFGAHLSASYEIATLGVAWYVAALVARKEFWLLSATLFWVFALVQPANNFWVLSVLTPCLAVLGTAIEKRSPAYWALPFYLLALCGVGMVIFSGYASGQVAALSWFLLGYALLAYGLGLITDRVIEPALTVVCSTLAIYIAASQLGDLYRPPVVALLGAGLGLLAGRVARGYGRSALRYALPFYASGLAAAVLTGVYCALGDLSRPFYGAIPDALFLYALVAAVVVWVEQRVYWNWLVAVFACWGVLLTQRLTIWYVLGAGVALVLAGLLSERLVQRALLARRVAPLSDEQSARLAPLPVRVSWLWPWPWYSAFLIAVFVLGSWPLVSLLVVPGMLVFTLLALVVMLERRSPELLPVPVGLATWTIALWLSPYGSTALIVAYTVLCALIYAAQFVWRLWPASIYRLPATVLHHMFALGGLCAVLLFAASQGALSSTAGMLAQAGVLALLTLSLLLFLYGLLHPANVARALPVYLETGREERLAEASAVRHWCYYVVGLLLSLAVSWELLAFGQTRFDTLSLVPASYLIIVAPFLLRDQVLPNRRAVGQWVALLGSAFLLLPALWFSFQGTDLLPTLILLVEALLLLLSGLFLRMRVFILSSAALIIIGTLRLLFLSMPPSIPILLLAFGTLLMALATALILARHRLQMAWSQWE